jgi:hypothetical protein
MNSQQYKIHGLAYVLISMGVWWLEANYHSISLYTIFSILCIVAGANLLRQSAVKVTLITGFISGVLGLLFYTNHLLSSPSVLSILLFAVFVLISHIYAQNLFPHLFVDNEKPKSSWYTFPLWLDLSGGGEPLPKSLTDVNKQRFIICNVVMLVLLIALCLLLILITLGVNIVSVTLFDQFAGALALIIWLPILIFLMIALATAHKSLAMRVCVTIFYGYLVLSNSYDALVHFDLYSFALVVFGAFGFLTGINFERIKVEAPQV